MYLKQNLCVPPKQKTLQTRILDLEQQLRRKFSSVRVESESRKNRREQMRSDGKKISQDAVFFPNYLLVFYFGEDF